MGRRNLARLGALLTFAPCGVHATPADVLSFQDCDTARIGEAALRSALELELPRTSTCDDSLRVDCEPLTKIEVGYRCDATAEIVVQRGAALFRRVVRFADVEPSDRPRAIALVVFEIVRGVTAERKPTPSKEAQPTQSNTTQPVAEPPADEPSDRRTPLSLSSAWRAALDARISAISTQPLLGGELAVDLSSITLAAMAQAGGATTGSGTVTGGIVALRVGHRSSIFNPRGLRLELGMSAGGGASLASGDSEDAAVVARTFWAPYADLRGDLRFVFTSLSTQPDISAYGGRAAGIAARAEGATVLATGGWIGGLQLGFRL